MLQARDFVAEKCYFTVKNDYLFFVLNMVWLRCGNVVFSGRYSGKNNYKEKNTMKIEGMFFEFKYVDAAGDAFDISSKCRTFPQGVRHDPWLLWI